MIDLDDDIWAEELTHAYGSARDIPDLLREVKRDPTPKSSSRDEPWFTLWSSLCHQGDVYDASFAAVPHLVAVLEQAEFPISWDFFALPAAIECSRVHGSVDMPLELSLPYSRALDKLLPTAMRFKGESWDHDGVQSVCAAIAAAQGAIDLADALLELGPEMTRRFLVREGLR